MPSRFYNGDGTWFTVNDDEANYSFFDASSFNEWFAAFDSNTKKYGLETTLLSVQVENCKNCTKWCRCKDDANLGYCVEYGKLTKGDDGQDCNEHVNTVLSL